MICLNFIYLKKCDQWVSNKVLFGCKSSNGNELLENLCQKSNIDSIVPTNDLVYVFRDGMYWTFNGLANEDKPIGDLVEAQVSIEQKWKGLNLWSGNFGSFKGELINVYNREMNFLANDGSFKSSPIFDTEETVIDYDSYNKGAVVPLNDNHFALIIGKLVKVLFCL